LVVVCTAAQAQRTRSEVAFTAEQHGVSLNVDLSYNRPSFFGVARIFIDEEDRVARARPLVDSPFIAEGGVGILIRTGSTVIGPLAGLDTERRVVAGSAFMTKVFNHGIAYLGYAKLSTRSTYEHVTRHRLLIDLNKDKRLFLRWDWKTEARKQAHSRVGIEFHTRWDKANLPIYVEPFWNFVGKQVGVRIGTKL
jgi:hypothetical protein